MPLARLASSFVDVKCHEGFHCVSAVDVFGRNHDFKFEGLPEGKVISQRYRGAYEDNCPARGEMTSSGDCRDTGKGPAGFCWSHNRFESGPDSPCKDPDLCKCVKNAEQGTATHSHQGESHQHVAGESHQGTDLLTRKYWVQPPAECEDCSQHNCSMESCNKCKNCEYGTKTFLGRTSKGCYDVDSGVARLERVGSDKGRKYLFAGMEGLDSTQKQEDLLVVPHYPMWDPGSTRRADEFGGAPTDPTAELKFPYQDRREPLSREAWIDAYKQAAPRIQNLLDSTASNVKEWGPKANDIDCTQDIMGRVSKVRMFRRECKKYQGLAQHLAPKTPFESNVPDDKGGFIPVKCKMGGQGMCEELNCYSDDADLIKGITHLNERARVCRNAITHLIKEEEKNGPIGEEAEISAHSGGRLEVALPPPGVEYQEPQGSPPAEAQAAAAAANSPAPAAMPVDAALALASAAGAAATSWHRFLSTNTQSRPGQASSPLSSRGSSSKDACRVHAQQHRRSTRVSRTLGDFL